MRLLELCGARIEELLRCFGWSLRGCLCVLIGDKGLLGSSEWLS